MKNRCHGPSAINQSRRALLGRAAALPTLGLLGGLSACGGGGSDGAERPQIQSLDAEGGFHLFVGEYAMLTPVFSGGSGRIEPGIGAVTSGVPVRTPALVRDTRYTLIVEATGRPPVQQDVLLEVRYRDRHTALEPAFVMEYHAAVACDDGSALLIGGSRGASVTSEAVDRYDPATRSFHRIGQLASGRDSHTATRLVDGRVLVVGGNVALTGTPLAELIDPRTGRVSPAGPLQRTRHRHAVVALADGRALVVGGLNRDSVELFDPYSNSFRLVSGRMAHVREFPSATLLADGRVLICGGGHLAASNQFAEIFDPVSEGLTPVAGGPDLRLQMHAAHRLADGRVLILGGETMGSDGELALQSGVLLFDPNTGKMSAQTPLAQARSLLRSVLLSDGRVLMFGGEVPAEPATRSVAAYRIGGLSESLATMPQPRSWHSVTLLGTGQLLIAGGSDAQGRPVAQTYLYD
jgi:hypothetical protein